MAAFIVLSMFLDFPNQKSPYFLFQIKEVWESPTPNIIEPI